MIFKRFKTGFKIGIIFIFLSGLSASEVQLLTTHKKSNGTLLRIVTSQLMDIDNIAGWVGHENWFYITLNGASLGETAMESIEYELPIMGVEASENNESVQLGYLFERPIEDFEIFHSKASRVLLIQVWESLNDSILTEVASSEMKNENQVFALPKKESKGSPFYDSFIYAREKYGPEKYFVWYDNWYSTEDVVGKNDENQNGPKPLIVKKQAVKKKEVLPPTRKTYTKSDIDLSWILNKGMLNAGISRPREVKELQRALIALGYKLGTDGVFLNGVDGDFGPATEDAVMAFQEDQGLPDVNVDGIVGQGTLKELEKALSNEAPKVHLTPKQKNKKLEKEKAAEMALAYLPESIDELLKRPVVKVQIKRETRKLNNPNILNTLPPDLSKRKTYLKLSCNLEGANVFIDGNMIGITPVTKKISVNPGWHRVRIIDPNAPPQKYSMRVPDYQDIYVPKGRTQKIRINLPVPDPESSN